MTERLFHPRPRGSLQKLLQVMEKLPRGAILATILSACVLFWLIVVMVVKLIF